MEYVRLPRPLKKTFKLAEHRLKLIIKNAVITAAIKSLMVTENARFTSKPILGTLKKYAFKKWASFRFGYASAPLRPFEQKKKQHRKQMKLSIFEWYSNGGAYKSHHTYKSNQLC